MMEAFLVMRRREGWCFYNHLIRKYLQKKILVVTWLQKEVIKILLCPLCQSAWVKFSGCSITGWVVHLQGRAEVSIYQVYPLSLWKLWQYSVISMASLKIQVWYIQMLAMTMFLVCRVFSYHCLLILQSGVSIYSEILVMWWPQSI
jgi:hypothetical protein